MAADGRNCRVQVLAAAKGIGSSSSATDVPVSLQFGNHLHAIEDYAGGREEASRAARRAREAST